MSRGQDQWAQCDNCCKWRKLPIDVFLPLKWTCDDNIWDLSRYSAFSLYDIFIFCSLYLSINKIYIFSVLNKHEVSHEMKKAG